MDARVFGNLFLIILLPVGSGCRLGVPIHVWQPAQIASAVGKRVVLQSVAGPPELTEPLTETLLASAPGGIGCNTTVVAADALQAGSTVALVSATDGEPSDIALASAARRQQFDFLLRGQVLQHQGLVDSDQPTASPTRTVDAAPRSHLRDAPPPGARPSRLTLTWSLTGLDGQSVGGGSPVVVELDSAIERYPDLALRSDPQEILTAAAVRDTYRLFTPSIDRRRVELAVPYFAPGSQQVRHGNRAALGGHWADAEEIWQDVLDTHPAQAAAAHNLALAAVARQDFPSAMQLARTAIRLQPIPLHKRTLVWIELRQREYHEAFDLPAPPEGWLVTRPDAN